MSSDHDQKVEEFVAITGGTKEMAASLLSVCNGNLEMAINMHMEGVQTEENQPGTSSASIPVPDEGTYFILLLLLFFAFHLDIRN